MPDTENNTEERIKPEGETIQETSEADNTFEETAQILAAVERFQEKQRERTGAAVKEGPKPEEEQTKTDASDDPKDPEQEKRELIPQRVIRDLVAIYLAYIIFTLVRSLRAGEVKEGHVVWVILAVILFAAGIVWLLLPEIKKLFKKKEF